VPPLSLLVLSERLASLSRDGSFHAGGGAISTRAVTTPPRLFQLRRGLAEARVDPKAAV